MTDQELKVPEPRGTYSISRRPKTPTPDVNPEIARDHPTRGFTLLPPPHHPDRLLGEPQLNHERRPEARPKLGARRLVVAVVLLLLPECPTEESAELPPQGVHRAAQEGPSEACLHSFHG